MKTIQSQVSEEIAARYDRQGIGILSNVELIMTIAIIPIEKSRKLLSSTNNDLYALGKLTVAEIMKRGEITKKQALRIACSYEFSKRKYSTDRLKREKIRCSADAYNIARGMVEDLMYEEFWVFYLNRVNEVIELKKISQGGISGTVTDIRLILNAAVEKLASAMILVHNHPSGNLIPSEADIKITEKAKEAASFFDISVLDHIIISDSGFMSFADDNLMC